MRENSKLIQLAELGFSLAGESVSLGFDLQRIAPTVAKLPRGLDSQFESLLADSWPSDFFLGSVEFFGPDRINIEHAELYPGLTVIEHGFFCFGSDGAGTLYTYCVEDGRVYLLPNENFSDDGMVSSDWAPIETSAANIKSVALQSWNSLDAFFDWALVELRRFEQQQADEEE